jgi:uncharacterized protein (TIGR02145 family)
VTTAIAVYPAISPGSITTASTTTKAGTPPNQIVDNSGTASGGSGSLTYVWVRTGTSSATLTGSTGITYDLNTAADNNYSTAGTYRFNRYAQDATCTNIAPVAAAGTYTLAVEAAGGPQPQGNCTYTAPVVRGTFAGFSSAYSASTYVSLTDERDAKVYPVVKIAGRWIMARNLNYQEGLTWQANSNQPSTTSGQDLDLIGHFWCPGGDAGESTATSTRASCDVWGALYSWETAMSYDGKGSWTESPSSYNTDAANTAAAKVNHGRTASGSGRGGRGICPPNWHVPTDNEWGIILDGMESGGGTVHQSSELSDWLGTDAGTRGKSKCTVGDNTT